MGVRFFPKCCPSVQTVQTAAGDWALDAAGAMRVSQVNTFRWGLWLNPTQSGGGALSFSNVPSSSVQNANGNGTRTIDPTTGINLFSGHQKTSTESIISQAVNTQRRIGISAGGTYDELVLAIAPITSNLVTISSINFTEFT